MARLSARARDSLPLLGQVKKRGIYTAFGASSHWSDWGPENGAHGGRYDCGKTGQCRFTPLEPQRFFITKKCATNREIKMKALVEMTTLAMGIAAIAVSPQTASAEKWDMPMAYAATDFHSEMGVVFADKVREYTNGDIDITVHPGVIVQGRRNQTRHPDRSGDWRTLYVRARQ